MFPLPEALRKSRLKSCFVDVKKNLSTFRSILTHRRISREYGDRLPLRENFLLLFFYTWCYKNNTMPDAPHSGLSRRERQIMDILYRLGRATANDVMAELSGNLNYSTVRTQLRVLENKGHVRHEEQGLRYIYMP